MRIVVIAFACVVLGGCNPIVETFPTAPTAAMSTAAMPAIALEVSTSGPPDFSSGSMQIGVRARAATGELTQADVECSASRGRVLPARFEALARVGTELGDTTMPTRVTCSAGDLVDSIDVDMSAWWIDLGYQEYDPAGPRAGETRVLIVPRQRIAGVEATRVLVDWGDGTTAFSPVWPPSTLTQLRHRYQIAGVRTATARVEWEGGFHEHRFTVFGGPAGSVP